VFEYASASVLYGEEPLEVACREMSNLGIRHLDLWHVKGWCEHLAGGIDRVRRTLAEYGIKLEAISAYSTPLEQLGDIVDAAKELGGTAVVTGSDKPDMSVAEFAEKIAPVAERAARAGVKLAIENHGNAVIDSIESMVELVRLVPEGLGIALALIVSDPPKEEVVITRTETETTTTTPTTTTVVTTVTRNTTTTTTETTRTITETTTRRPETTTVTTTVTEPGGGQERP